MLLAVGVLAEPLRRGAGEGRRGSGREVAKLNQVETARLKHPEPCEDRS